MWKYFSTLLFIMLVILTIGFVRNNYYSRIKNPLHTELQLAANFGELRPDHFHMGLDIRTGGKENLPVYSIEEGYISRVKVEAGGYGKAVFITHANGFTSLYAHLNNFSDEVEKTVYQNQYANKCWQQDISFAAGRFPVKKGELIAYSGNTGHSEGPHLHFELRDTRTGNNLNPALYGFVVKDNTPPAIVGLYWYDRRYSTYQSGPNAIDLKRKIVKVTSPVISLGIRTDDRVDDSRFRYGIFRMQAWVDDVLIHDVSMNGFSDSDARYVNAYIDYRMRITKGQNIQHLSRLPGNRLPIYANADGIIRLQDKLPHRVHIKVTDIAGNAADQQFEIQLGSIDPVKHKIVPGVRLLGPGQTNIVNGDRVVVRFGKKAFYDAVPFLLKEIPGRSNQVVSPRIQLHDPTVPIHDRYTVSIKSGLRHDDRLREKTVMQFSGFKNKSVVKGKWEGSSMTASFNELGTVQLLIDTVSPQIMIKEETEKITVTVADNLGEISDFTATLDGQWILFSQKGNVFTYEFDGHCKPGRHRLNLKVTDVAGNMAEENFSFTSK